MSFPDFITRNVSLKPFNTFGMAVFAEAYMEVNHLNDLTRIFRDASLRALPRLIIGGGSNLLLTKDFAGLVLRVCLKGIHLEKEDSDFAYVRAAAGETWRDFVQWTLKKGWGGLENLSGIPGTVGAAPVQNIGAYGSELDERLFSLRVFDFETGKLVEMGKEACCFSYRNSIFKQKGMKGRLLIVDVLFALPKVWSPNIRYAEVEKELQQKNISQITPQEISRIIVSIRQRKIPDPAVLGNVGSFFKNPTVTAERLSELKKTWPTIPAYGQLDGRFRIAAGWLIEQCGWKGKKKGDAGVCEKQALVLVNYGQATGKEMLALAKAIQSDVFNRFAIHLELEAVLV